MITKNIVFRGSSVNDAWNKIFKDLANQENVEESRDGNVSGEIINCIVVISNPLDNIVTSPERNMSMKYAIGEFLWYLSGNPKLSAINLITKNWERFSDDGETVNSNYGNCIFKKYGFDQLAYVEDELKRNRNSRRAIIHIKEASDKQSKDVNCTISVQFMIRDNKLYMTVNMRSNDIWYGFPYDAFFFANLQVLLAMKLDVKVGEYTHIAGSMHLYERDKIKMIAKKEAKEC